MKTFSDLVWEEEKKRINNKIKANFYPTPTDDEMNANGIEGMMNYRNRTGCTVVDATEVIRYYKKLKKE